MRELVFALEYQPGCNRVADALSDHPDARIRSLSLHATAERLWRVDHATGTPAALEDIENAFLTADYYTDCLATRDCGATQETQVLDHTGDTLVLYSYWDGLLHVQDQFGKGREKTQINSPGKRSRADSVLFVIEERESADQLGRYISTQSPNRAA